MTEVSAARPPGDAVPPAPASSPAGPKRSAHRARYFVVAAVLAGAFAFLLAKGLGGSLDYFETVDQAAAQRAQLGSSTVRLEGLVVAGTVVRTAEGVQFVAAGARHRILVENTGNPPQLFQPNVPVVVVGHFSGTTFLSTQIIVDHSAQYIEQYPNRVRAPDGSSR
ncbi:MAG: cytochrome c maturation protein CcmE [Acidimicrobiales bacterium]